jgi:ascorbate-specific PTS system EIIC-type component UlaA
MMNTTSRPLDTPAFLISLLGGFTLVALLAPGIAKAPKILGGLGLLFLGVGGWLISKAARQFSSRWQQILAVSGVVVIWYAAFLLIGGARPDVF